MRQSPSSLERPSKPLRPNWPPKKPRALKLPWAAVLIFYFYRLLIVPISFLLLNLLRPFAPEKLKSILNEKNQSLDIIRNIKITSCLWIHASSGEVEYAKPLFREIKKKYTETPIVLTYSSVSIKKLIQKESLVDYSFMLPWDFPWCISFIIQHLRPKALLIARTDAWPETIYQCRRHDIPTLMFAATLSSRSQRTKGFSRLLNQFVFLSLDQIFCVSEDDQKEFLKIHKHISAQVSGDTRYDQVLFRISEENKTIKILTSPENLILVAGSTWPEDEQKLLPAWANFPRIKLILAPHEVSQSRLKEIEEKLIQLEKRSIRYSQIVANQSTNEEEQIDVFAELDVILVDQVGLLADLYRVADFAFVGGSFKDKVHSVMEPLACGLSVLVGPFFGNNREATQFMQLGVNHPFVKSVQTEEEIKEYLQNFLSLNKSQRDESKTAIKTEVLHRAGASVSVLNWLNSKN